MKSFNCNGHSAFGMDAKPFQSIRSFYLYPHLYTQRQRRYVVANRQRQNVNLINNFIWHWFIVFSFFPNWIGWFSLISTLNVIRLINSWPISEDSTCLGQCWIRQLLVIQTKRDRWYLQSPLYTILHHFPLDIWCGVRTASVNKVVLSIRKVVDLPYVVYAVVYIVMMTEEMY